MTPRRAATGIYKQTQHRCPATRIFINKKDFGFPRKNTSNAARCRDTFNAAFYKQIIKTIPGCYRRFSKKSECFVDCITLFSQALEVRDTRTER